MMINKNNYEAYLLDYLEGSITPQDEQALMLFFKQHPELKHELDTADIDVQLIDEEKIIFGNKKDLFKHEANIYELPVSDYLLIKKMEEGLSDKEEAELLLSEPDVKIQSLNTSTYLKTILKADTKISYNDKHRLRRLVIAPAFSQYLAQRMAAAVAIIVLIASVWTIGTTPLSNEAQLVENNSIQITKTVEPTFVVESKILEKKLPDEAQPSKDSLLNLAKDPMELKKKTKDTPNQSPKEKTEYLASINDIEHFVRQPINAYEHGLNVMMPQYMDNNLLRQELASIYRKIEEDESTPSLSLALVESGVKVMNFLSKESVKMQKYYNDNGDIVGYKVKGDNLEVNKKLK